MRRCSLLAVASILASYDVSLAKQQVLDAVDNPSSDMNAGAADTTGSVTHDPEADVATAVDASMGNANDLGSLMTGLADGDAVNTTASVAQAAVFAADPELAVLMSGVTPGMPLTPTWNENATRQYYNSAIGLLWQHTLGDYLPTPVGSTNVADVNRRQVIRVNVTGNDFYILNTSRQFATFDSRFASASLQPTLVVNGSVKYTATRNTSLSSTTALPSNGHPTVKDAQVMLVAFDNYQPKSGDTAQLFLTSEAQYGNHKLTFYRPDIHPVYPIIDSVAGGSLVDNFQPTDFHLGGTVGITNDYLAASWGGSKLTALDDIFKLPPANEYYLTVVIRLQNDWSDQGGKLPGLANTGQATHRGGGPLIINGVDCSNSGWGGRPANGCRWSARTGWGGRSDNQVGLHTYYYAQQPHSTWGVGENWPTPAPVGQWFAYVERVRMNTIGQSDGRLSYWMCTQAGCNPQFDRTNIVWRSADLPESQITEAWANVYCGGLSCGPKVIPTSTVNLTRMTVTTGLPDMNALLGEVHALNASGN